MSGGTQDKDVVWILYCLAAFVGNTSMCVANSIGDSLAINSCQKKEINYGQYRLWGPVGFGIFGAIWGVANEIPSMPKYTPGIITMVVILIINNLLLAFWYDKDEFKIISAVPSGGDSEDISLANQNYGSTNRNVQINDGGGDQASGADEGAVTSTEPKKVNRL